MNEDRIKQAFNVVRAEAELKENTKKYLAEKAKGKRAPRYRRLATVMACLVLLLVGAGGYGIYYTPVSAISMDINPSIELKVNRFGKVVSLEDYNGDGKKLLESLHIKYLDYEKAIDMVLENETVKTYLNGGEELFITVTGEDERRCTQIVENISYRTKKEKNIHCNMGNAEEAVKAKETGLSYGKYRAFLQLKKLDETVMPEDVQGLTMRQIRDRIGELSGEADTGMNGQGKKHRRGQSK